MLGRGHSSAPPRNSDVLFRYDAGVVCRPGLEVLDSSSGFRIGLRVRVVGRRLCHHARPDRPGGSRDHSGTAPNRHGAHERHGLHGCLLKERLATALRSEEIMGR